MTITVAFAAAIALAAAQPAPADLGPGLPSPAEAAFLVEPVVEKIVADLPPGPLYWRIERFADLAAATAAAGPHALAAETWGAAWLATLGPKDGATEGGERIAEIGPVPVPSAARYRLRLNRAAGPPGARTPVHTHPGSEAFYVLRGELTQHTPHGAARLGAGKAMNGHSPGMVMQLESSGAEPLEQLVLFVVDADKPFSSPARFDPAGGDKPRRDEP